jgi:hypothetical protein
LPCWLILTRSLRVPKSRRLLVKSPDDSFPRELAKRLQACCGERGGDSLASTLNRKDRQLDDSGSYPRHESP